MAKTATITRRVDFDLNDDAELTFSTPFEFRADDIPNEETNAAIEEVEHGIGLSRTFDGTDDLMRDLMFDA